MRDQLDALDMRLLEALQRDNLQTAEQLASQLGRSPSALARRLRRLRASGAIAADVAIVADAAAGALLFAVIQIQLERHALSEAELFRRRIAESDHVQFYFEISGAFDIMLLVVATDMTAFNDFADVTLANEPAVRRYETTFVKKKGKATLRVPLRPAIS